MTTNPSPSPSDLMRDAATMLRYPNQYHIVSHQNLADKLDALAAQLEQDTREVSESVVVEALREAVSKECDGRFGPTVRGEAWATRHRISPGEVYSMLDEDIEPTDEICTALGFERRVVYARKEPS